MIFYSAGIYFVFVPLWLTDNREFLQNVLEPPLPPRTSADDVTLSETIKANIYV